MIPDASPPPLWVSTAFECTSQQPSLLTADEVEERRSNTLFEKLRTTLEGGEFKRHDEIIDRLLDAGHTPTDIASALFSMLEGESARPAQLPRFLASAPRQPVDSWEARRELCQD